MSKIFQLVDDLTSCYASKAPFAEDYIKITPNEKNQMCYEVRKALIDYVNSPEYAFSDIAKNLYNSASSK